jgi:hypothetical protein
VLLAEFDGEPTTYREKISVVREGDRYAGDYARNDPNGFYHGMTVTSGGSKCVLVGPPLELVAERPKVDLFASVDDEEEEDYEVDDYEEEEDCGCDDCGALDFRNCTCDEEHQLAAD